jgi:hypothetical protein
MSVNGILQDSLPGMMVICKKIFSTGKQKL